MAIDRTIALKLIGLSVAVFGGIQAYGFYVKSKKENSLNVDNTNNPDSPFMPANIETTIRDTAAQMGMPTNMQYLLVAQAKFETANFTSNVFKTNNNLYGYKRVAGAKYQIGLGLISPEGNNYADYATLEDSVKEVCAWIRRRQNEGKFPADLTTLNADSYAALLKPTWKFGITAESYANGLKRYL